MAQFIHCWIIFVQEVQIPSSNHCIRSGSNYQFYQMTDPAGISTVTSFLDTLIQVMKDLLVAKALPSLIDPLQYYLRPLKHLKMCWKALLIPSELEFGDQRISVETWVLANLVPRFLGLFGQRVSTWQHFPWKRGMALSVDNYRKSNIFFVVEPTMTRFWGFFYPSVKSIV